MSDKEEKKDETPKEQESWLQKKWRPMMGWIYMVTCSCDFILFPVLWSILQSSTGASVTQWNPITLQGAGLYHLAMGAVLGVAAWSRGQEKIAGVASQPQPTTVTTTTQQIQYSQPQPMAYQEPRSMQPQVSTGFGGKPAPQQHFPEI